MALDNTNVTRWSALVELAAQEASIAGQLANGLYQPDAANAYIVQATTFGVPTIGDYTGADISYEELSDSELDITMDQKKYYAFRVEDDDRAATLIDLESAPIQQAGRGLAITTDTYAFSQATSGAGTALDDGDFGGSGGSAFGVNSSNVEEAISSMVETLDTNNAGPERVMVVSPWFHQKMIMAGLDRLLQPEESPLYREGFIGRFNGLDIFKSNQLVVPSAGEVQVLAMTRRALPFAASVNQSEVLRLEAKFATAYRGLYIFGAGVLFANEIVSLHTTKAAEA